jgi:hypothetical protein
MLLARVEVDPDQKADIGKKSNLQRCGKFAAFPDGTPFNIQLLLPDKRGRGKARSQENSFDRLPDAIKLITYCSVLRDERSGQFQDAKGKSLNDAKLIGEIVNRLEGKGVLDVKDLPAAIRTTILRLFRVRLKRCGLEHLALKKSDRNKRYATEEDHLDSGEESKS